MTPERLKQIARKLRTYAEIYTGDKEARAMADDCERAAAVDADPRLLNLLNGILRRTEFWSSDTRDDLKRDLQHIASAAKEALEIVGADVAAETVPEKPLLHAFKPHQEYPWFCAHCGYPRHETLKHIQEP